MKYSQRFLPLKVYLATSMFLGQPGICQFISPNFRIIPDRFPWYPPPVGILFPGLTLENFWKFSIFPGEPRSHHRGTEAGCFIGYFYFGPWKTWTLKNLRSGKPRPWKSSNNYWIKKYVWLLYFTKTMRNVICSIHI